MKRRGNLTLKTVGDKYMLVDTANGKINLTAVYIMNRTAAWLWENLDECNSRIDELAINICMTFDVDYDRALRDIQAQLIQWQEMGLFEK